MKLKDLLHPGAIKAGAIKARVHAQMARICLMLAQATPRPVYAIPTSRTLSRNRDETVRRVAVRNAEGSVRLSRGQIASPARIEALYGRLHHVDF